MECWICHLMVKPSVLKYCLHKHLSWIIKTVKTLLRVIFCCYLSSSGVTCSVFLSLIFINCEGPFYLSAWRVQNPGVNNSDSYKQQLGFYEHNSELIIMLPVNYFCTFVQYCRVTLLHVRFRAYCGYAQAIQAAKENMFLMYVYSIHLKVLHFPWTHSSKHK